MSLPGFRTNPKMLNFHSFNIYWNPKVTWQFLFCLRNRSALAVTNCWVIIHCLEVSCDQITNVKREWFICLQRTDKQWITYYSTIHALALIYFDSNAQETMKKRLYPSDSFNCPPLHWRNPAEVLTVTQAFTWNFDVYNAQNDVTPSNVKEKWSMGRMAS